MLSGSYDLVSLSFPFRLQIICCLSQVTGLESPIGLIHIVRFERSLQSTPQTNTWEAGLLHRRSSVHINFQGEKVILNRPSVNWVDF